MLNRLAVTLFCVALGTCGPPTDEDVNPQLAGDVATAGDSAGGDDAFGDPGLAGGDGVSGDPGLASGDSAFGDPETTGDSQVLCTRQQAEVVIDVTVDDLKQSIDAGELLAVVDVRESYERAGGIIEGALLYPWTSGVLRDEHANLPRDRPLHIICRSGNRSPSASQFLVDNGHSCVRNVLGGMNAWTAAAYPTVIP